MEPQPEKLDLGQRIIAGTIGSASLTVGIPVHLIIVSTMHYDGKRTSTGVDPKYHGEALYQEMRRYVRSNYRVVMSAIKGEVVEET